MKKYLSIGCDVQTTELDINCENGSCGWFIRGSGEITLSNDKYLIPADASDMQIYIETAFLLYCSFLPRKLKLIFCKAVILFASFFQ